MPNTLVTGGNGFLGRNLRIVQPNFNYTTHNEFDLTKENDVMSMYKKYKPNVLIHFAGKVGSIKNNSIYPAKFYYENMIMNSFIIHYAYLFGVKKVVALMSTNAFPEKVKKFPIIEKDLHFGPPHINSYSYGYTKRMIDVQIKAYRKEYDVNYFTISPCNLYGYYDKFDSNRGHLIPSLIKKIHDANSNKMNFVELLGTGKPRRQFLFVDDFITILLELLNVYDDSETIIIAPNSNNSIKGIAQLIKKITNFNGELKFNGKFDGPINKSASNDKLIQIIGNFNFTPLQVGLENTYNWFLDSKNKKYQFDY